MAVAIPYLVQGFIGIAIGSIAASLLKPKSQKTPIVDEKPSSTSTRGSYIPFLCGRRRIGAHIAWVGERTSTTEGSAGGKGSTGSGSQQTVYRESAHHILAVGPAWHIHKIWSNGKEIYAPNGGISPLSHPSGTSVTISGFGTFVIYWGEADQPIDTFLGVGTRVGISTRWKFAARIVWKQVRLGGFPTWPAIEYELEVRPYKPGQVVGGDYDALPNRLSGSSSWAYSEFGPDPGAIYNILDGYNRLEVPASGGTIKIAGNHTTDFTSSAKAKVTGQPYNLYLTQLLHVQSSSYSAGETYYTPHGYTDNSTDFTGVPTNAAWVKTNVTVTAGTPGSAPAGGTPYIFTAGAGFPNQVIWNGAGVTSGDRNLGRFLNKITFYVKQFGTGAFVQFKVGFLPFSGVTNNSHVATFNWSGGTTTVSVTNGLKVKEILPPPAVDWRQFECIFVSNHGATPSNQTWTCKVLFETPFTSTYAGINWLRDNGASATGVTTIDFQEPLEEVDVATGTIQRYALGFGPGGPNAAHVIDQLFFETFPHGAGLDRSLFDIPSLEAVGTALENENLRTNAYGPDGKDFESIATSVMLDAGIFCSWDRIDGKFKFVLLRDPTGLTIPTIPEELINRPLPEIATIREAKTDDKAIFGFPDVALAYRDNVVVVNDDGRASIDNNQKGRIIALDTSIDAETTVKIAERRAWETLINKQKSVVHVLRDAGDLYPGQVFNNDNFEDIMRVIEADVDPKTRNVKFEVLADNYGLSPNVAQSFSTLLPPTPAEPSPDLAVKLAELPPGMLRGGARGFVALRIRADETSDGASVWISEDNATFRMVSRNARYVTGGVLYEAIASGSSDIVTGPIIYATGPDMVALAQSLTTDEWVTGRQLWICGDECGFLKDVVPLGDGFFRLDGLKRGKFRSGNPSHAIGDQVYIVDPRRLDPIYDPAVTDGKVLYIKTQPRSSTAEVSLGAVSSVTATMSTSGPNIPIPMFTEIPAGTIDGVNATFTLQQIPNPRGSLILKLNGITLTYSVDYSILGTTITMFAGQIPQVGDSFIANFYQS